MVDARWMPASLGAALQVEVVLHLLIFFKSKTGIRVTERKKQIQNKQAQETANVKVNSKKYELEHHCFEAKSKDDCKDEHAAYFNRMLH
jgi:hypothetical protein